MAARKRRESKPNAKKEQGGEGGEEFTLNIPSNLLGGLDKYTKDPLTLTSLAVSLLAVARPFLGEGSISDSMPYLMAAGLLISIYLASISLKGSRKNYMILGIPLLIFVVTLFSWYVNEYAGVLDRDYRYFAVVAAFFLAGYTLTINRIVSPETGIVGAIIISALLLHLVPALEPLLGNLDSYWQYKFMQGVYVGQIPEYDDLVYPLVGGLQYHNDTAFVQSRSPLGHGLAIGVTSMMTPVVYGFLALILKPFGFSLYDIAILLPGVLGGLCSLLIYLLVRELFADMEPYNKIAAALAAFMLLLSPGFAINGTASNCEDDVLGMFLMLGGLFLFFTSVNRRSVIYAIIGGIAFLMLRVGWGGYAEAYLVAGVFSTAYAVVSFLRRENCMRLVPYFIILIAIAEIFGPFFLHPRGASPNFSPPMGVTDLLPILGAIGGGIILEFIRKQKYGELLVKGDRMEDRMANLLEKNITLLFIVVVVVGAFAFYTAGNFSLLVGLVNILTSVKERSVVHATVAEQNPMAGGDTWSQFLTNFVYEGYDKFGIAVIYGLLMLVPLTYLVFKRNSTGALFVMFWSLPLMWGAANKSAWIFTAAPSVAALGGTIGLLAAASRKDIEGLRIIGTLLVLLVPVTYIPFLGTSYYAKFVGYAVMHMGLTPDIYYWQPALEWHRDYTDASEAVLTWWDYGHWITAVSQRPVLIDNLQADYYEIQDVARFFVNATSEEEAFKTVLSYNEAYKQNGRELKYVMIDWTMIGKGSALHYISQGDIKNNIPARPEIGWKNYVQCSFSPEQSVLQPKIVTNEDGSISYQRYLVFPCQGYIGGIIFVLSGDNIKEINVVTPPTGSLVPWSSWVKKYDASLLGVEPLFGSRNEQGIPGILQCAANWDKVQGNSLCTLPQFHTLVYVPGEFSDFMMTRLYLSDYINEYKELGLYNREVVPLKHYRLLKDFSFGYVRTYEIVYNATVENESVGGQLNVELTNVSVSI